MGNEGNGNAYQPVSSCSGPPNNTNNKNPTYDSYREQPLYQNPTGIDNFDNLTYD